VWVILGTAVAVAIFGLALAAQSKSKWKDFLGRLNAQPGLIVTDARQGWLSSSQVSGLRDASSADPAALAREAKLDPARIRFHWKEYLALDPASVRRRFEQRFGVPNETRIALKDGVLTLSGSIPYEWLERVRREATLIPGVTSIADRAADISYDQDLTRKRFEQQLGLLETVNAVVAHGVLTLSGEASHRWLTRARTEAVKLPGITSVDDRAVIDLDQRAFEQSKSIIETAFVYFLTDKDDIATEGFAALSRLPDEIRRCEKAAKQLDMDVTLEIHGRADAVGSEARNVDLRQQRANKVRDFLVSCGFEPTRLKPIGMEQPFKPADADKAAPEQSERRVAFKIVTQPSILSP
jgi:outer membrane protein OmpA-like peptidoglycan-associated protein